MTYCVKDILRFDVWCKYEHKKNVCNKIKLIKDKERKDNEEKEIMKLKLQKDILKLKLELNKTKPTNFKSLNKMLKDKSYNSNNVINSNNTINNTFNLIGFGKENILETLSLNDKKIILSSKYQCIEKLIEISNCGNNNQYIRLVREKCYFSLIKSIADSIRICNANSNESRKIL